ncbi:peptide ABC transporter permease [bacterium SCGC AG-212-C10]|nr:peptide ABC transporter permease [bacterium SCGC AG-212-C10]
MYGYALRRVLAIIPLLWAVATLTFFLMHAVPGGPFDAGDKALPPAVRDALNRKYGLDDSIGQQYLHYMRGLVQGDLGISFSRGRPVTDILGDGLPTTFQLGMCAFAFAFILGLTLGVVSAVNQNGPIDYIAVIFATAGAAVPGFVVAVFLVVFFALKLSWFDVIGWEFGNYHKMVLPTVSLGLFPAAYIARITRASMLEVLRQDYIRTARAKGLIEYRVVIRHAARNALVPVLTVSGPIFAGLVTGSFVIERTFAISGIGTSFVDAVANRDYGMIMGTTLLFAVVIALMNLLVDLAYGIADPRIRY